MCEYTRIAVCEKLKCNVILPRENVILPRENVILPREMTNDK
ncbi:hypothetical protein PBCV1_a066aL [Paramecium bursaria Chlorella virus 1]|uniref:Uncharacterized protein n=1 Tax=Paramecium bursaria Chlorella virus 1 TaxID=10506 RepID=F8TTW5_PBCV1|nr:hypothetical protein PBCV1_a066aL [Paramecium bursaria Chlorella virus 1]AEI70026.1 hypothetical protein [Paramecium bursaria Chlorella virus 1]